MPYDLVEFTPRSKYAVGRYRVGVGGNEMCPAVSGCRPWVYKRGTSEIISVGETACGLPIPSESSSSLALSARALRSRTISSLSAGKTKLREVSCRSDVVGQG
jgi:hypothetical protein